jgi:hypothetical protein
MPAQIVEREMNAASYLGKYSSKSVVSPETIVALLSYVGYFLALKIAESESISSKKISFYLERLSDNM